MRYFQCNLWGGCVSGGYVMLCSQWCEMVWEWHVSWNVMDFDGFCWSQWSQVTQQEPLSGGSASLMAHGMAVKPGRSHQALLWTWEAQRNWALEATKNLQAAGADAVLATWLQTWLHLGYILRYLMISWYILIQVWTCETWMWMRASCLFVSCL